MSINVSLEIESKSMHTLVTVKLSNMVKVIFFLDRLLYLLILQHLFWMSPTKKGINSTVHCQNLWIESFGCFARSYSWNESWRVKNYATTFLIWCSLMASLIDFLSPEGWWKRFFKFPISFLWLAPFDLSLDCCHGGDGVLDKVCKWKMQSKRIIYTQWQLDEWLNDDHQRANQMHKATIIIKLVKLQRKLTFLEFISHESFSTWLNKPMKQFSFVDLTGTWRAAVFLSQIDHVWTVLQSGEDYIAGDLWVCDGLQKRT